MTGPLQRRSLARRRELGACCEMRRIQLNTHLRLLWVEDQAVTALDLAQQLGDFGDEFVGIAASGERAQALAAASRPDLVLMGVVIKGLQDGIETARAIPADLDLPVFLLTAYSGAANCLTS